MSPFKQKLVIPIFIIIFIGSHFYIIQAIVAPEEEVIVESKETKKGLFIFPRYEIQVAGAENATLLSRAEFETIQEGDTVSGYCRMRGATFVTKEKLVMDSFVYLPLMLLLYIILFLIIVRKTYEKKKWQIDNERIRKRYRTLYKNGFLAGLILYFLVGITFTAILLVNVFHKMNTTQLVEREAIILHDDDNKTNKRGLQWIVQYEDEAGEEYRNIKTVTKNTYQGHKEGDQVTIQYRKQNPHDIFIANEEAREYIGAIFHPYTVLLFIFYVTLFLLLIYRDKVLNNLATAIDRPVFSISYKNSDQI